MSEKSEAARKAYEATAEMGEDGAELKPHLFAVDAQRIPALTDEIRELEARVKDLEAVADAAVTGRARLIKALSVSDRRHLATHCELVIAWVGKALRTAGKLKEGT